MQIELHAIQNFAPSNLNRDDTGAPKDCIFGGYRRARISSQCLKRAMRDAFRDGGLLPEGAIGTRTKRIAEQLIVRLTDRGISEEEAKPLVERALGGIGLKIENDEKTQYLLFVGAGELDAIANLCIEHQEALAGGGATAEATGRGARGAKREARGAVSGTIQRAFREAMDGGKAADIALFGRMVADNAEINTDAASQVAHALSTHKAEIEFDYYTAVDDLNPAEETGAGMIGTVEFNSACFYRYANVDLDQLHRNLKGDETAMRRTVEAFVRAFQSAIPTGKQNSMAAQNPPSLVYAVVRERGNWSLANAFAKPVQSYGEGLVANSVAALDGYWGKLLTGYGDTGIRGQYCFALDTDGLNTLAGAHVTRFEELVQGVLGTAFVEAGG